MNDKIKSTLIIGIAIVFTGFFLGKSFKNRNANLDSISVIGLGTKDFVSDEILWSGSFTTNSFDIKMAYNKIVSDQKIVSDFFVSKGFKTSEFSFGAVNFQKKFKEIKKVNTENNNQNEYEQVFDGYEATQTINFSAKKNPGLMARIENVSSKTSELIKQASISSSSSLGGSFLGTIARIGFNAFAGGGSVPLDAPNVYNPVGEFAEGGAVKGGMPITVGERGREMFIPSSNGTIVPNQDLGGGTNITFNIQANDVRGIKELLIDNRATIINLVNQGANAKGRSNVV